MAVNPPFIDPQDADKIAAGWPDNVAEVILYAWSNPPYRRDLLTYPLQKGETEDQARQRTKNKLFERGIDISQPVVLTRAEFLAYAPRADEVVLLLPDPFGKGTSLNDAKHAMVFHCLGV